LWRSWPTVFETSTVARGSDRSPCRGAKTAERVAKRLHRSCGLLAAALGCSCTASEPGANGRTFERDSAGILIVENALPNAVVPLKLSAKPLITIGSADGVPGELLHEVRDAVRLRNGGIAVANGGSQQILIYDSAGSYVRTVGGRGAGPGEFRALSWIGEVAGDTVVALDGVGHRMSYFLPTGDFARSFQLPRPPDIYAFDPVDVLDYGTFLFRDTRRQAVTVGSIQRTRATLVRVTATGVIGDALDTVFDATLVGNPPGPPRTFLQHAPRSAQATFDGGFYHAPGDRYEIVHYSTTGVRLRLIRLARPARPVDDAVRRAYDAEVAARFAARPIHPELKTAIDNPTFLETLPAHGRILASRNGWLWVQVYSLISDTPTEWDVFDPRGHYRGAVELPARFSPTDIGTDYVLGMWRDTLNVEHVQLWRTDIPPGK
jgi:hypothetical protein